MVTMNVFEPILTDRLLLRKLEITDLDDFFEYRSLPEIYEFQSFKPEDLKKAKEFFSKISSIPDIRNTWFQLAVCIKENSKLIGDIGIHYLNDDAQVEVGYTIAPIFQRNGYATEALIAVIQYLFYRVDKHRIIASVDPRNERSIKLLEKIGMRKEAHFIKSIKADDLWLDDCIYALLKEEWIF